MGRFRFPLVSLWFPVKTKKTKEAACKHRKANRWLLNYSIGVSGIWFSIPREETHVKAAQVMLQPKGAVFAAC